MGRQIVVRLAEEVIGAFISMRKANVRRVRGARGKLGNALDTEEDLVVTTSMRTANVRMVHELA